MTGISCLHVVSLYVFAMIVVSPEKPNAVIFSRLAEKFLASRNFLFLLPASRYACGVYLKSLFYAINHNHRIF